MRSRWRLIFLGAALAAGPLGCSNPFSAPKGLSSSYTSENYDQFAKDYQERSIVAPGIGLDNNLEPSTTKKIGTAVAAVPAKVGDSLKSGTTKLVSWTTPVSTTTTDSEAQPTTTSWFSKKKEPTPDLCVATARMYEKSGNFAAASEQYEKALKKAPNNIPALLGYAHLLDHQGKLAEATTQYQRAIKANPREAAAYNDLGLCMARRGMVNEANHAVAKAVELQPDRVLYRNNLAKLLVEQNRSEEALAQLRAVHTEAISHYNLAILLDEHKQESLAESHLKRALELDPSFAQARDWTVRIAARTGNFPGTSTIVPGMATAPGAVPIAPRPGSYGMAPEPAASKYLRPEMSSSAEPGMVDNLYGAAMVPAGSTRSSYYSHPNDPANPPTPDSISNYQPAIDSDLHFLPPVN